MEGPGRGHLTGQAGGSPWCRSQRSRAELEELGALKPDGADEDGHHQGPLGVHGAGARAARPSRARYGPRWRPVISPDGLWSQRREGPGPRVGKPRAVL